MNDCKQGDTQGNAFGFDSEECAAIAHDLAILQHAGADRSELNFSVADLELIIRTAKGDFELIDFHDVPAECENRECANCRLSYEEKAAIDCPYLETKQSFTEFLASYIEEKSFKTQRPIFDDLTILANWIEQGINAFESLEKTQMTDKIMMYDVSAVISEIELPDIEATPGAEMPSRELGVVPLIMTESLDEAKEIYSLCDKLGDALRKKKFNQTTTENLESQQIRELVKKIPTNFVVKLPALSPDKWWDGTVENSKMTDVFFVDVNIVDLLSYIADMAE